MAFPMSTQKKASIVVIVILLAGVVAIFSYFALRTNTVDEISSFEECAEAGNPIMESYPRQCTTEDGEVFTEVIEPTSPPPQSIQFMPIDYASPSAEFMREQEEFRVIQSEEEWNEQFSQSPPPMVDFSKNTLLALFSGEKPSGGYFITVEEVVDVGDRVVVRVKQASPGEDCVTTQALTYPHTFVAIPKTDKPIEFESQTVVQNCE